MSSSSLLTLPAAAADGGLLIHFDNSVQDAYGNHVLSSTAIGYETDDLAVGSAAAVFNGTTSQIDADPSDDWDVLASTGSYVTIDFFAKFDGTKVNSRVMEQTRDGNNQWRIYYEPGIQALTFSAWSGGANIISMTSPEGSITKDDWHHLAVIRIDADWGIYVDGQHVMTAPMTGTLDQNETLWIGVDASGGNHLKGLLDELRIRRENSFNVDDVTLSSSTIAVPENLLNVPPPPRDALLAHFDQTVEDSYGHHNLITNSITYDTVEKARGSASAKFDGINSHIEVADSDDWDVVASFRTQVTIDFFAKFDGTKANSRVMEQTGNGFHQWRIYYEPGIQALTLSAWNGSNILLMTAEEGSVAKDAWHHFALIKIGRDWGMYVDCRHVATARMTERLNVSDASLWIGVDANDGNFMKGWLDDLHIRYGNPFGVVDVTDSGSTIVCPAMDGADDSPPHVTITAPADGVITASSEIQITASVLDDSPTSVVSTPAGLGGFLPAGGGTAGGTVTLSVEGENTISVNATDSQGNTGGTSITVIRDSIAPALTVTSPSSGAVVSTSPVTFNVGVLDASASTVSFGANLLSVPAGGGSVSGPVALVEGSNSISTLATDAAGNVATLTHSLVLDPQAPTVTITSPANGVSFGPGDSPITVTAAVADLTATTVSSTPAGVSASLPAGGGVAGGTVELGEGYNTITVSATDQAAQSGSDSIVVVLDTTSPNLTIASPAAGAVVRGTIDFHVEATDSLPGSPGTGVFWVKLFVDGDTFGTLLTPPYEASLDTAALADGVHTLRATAADGKENSATVEVGVLVDNTPPAVAVVSPLAAAFVAGTIEFDAEASDGGSGLVSVVLQAGGLRPTLDPSITFPSPVQCAALHGEEATLRRPDGPLYLTAIARDAAGNESQAAREVEVDNTTPARIVVRPAEGSVVSGNIEVLVEVIDEPNLATIELFVEGVLLGSSSTSPLAVPFDTTSRLDGPLTIRAVAYDLAGNHSTSTTRVTADNLQVALSPRTLNLKSKNMERPVNALIEGPNVDLLIPTEEVLILLYVPGGNAVYATPGFVGDDAPGDQDGDGVPDLIVRFDRGELIQSIRAGISAGMIQPDSQVVLEVRTAGGSILGSDLVRIHGN